MKRMLNFFKKNDVVFQRPLMYWLNSSLVLPVSSIRSYQEPLIRQNAIFINLEKKPIEPLDSEIEVLSQLREKEKIYPDHPTLSKYLGYLSTIYLSQGRLAEGEASMKRAVELDSLIVGDYTTNLPRLNNHGIISHLLTGDAVYRNMIFELAVKNWLKSNYRLDVKALPYFYNLVAANATEDKELLAKAMDVLESIYPKLDDQYPWKELFPNGSNDINSSFKPT